MQRTKTLVSLAEKDSCPNLETNDNFCFWSFNISSSTQLIDNFTKKVL